MKAMIHRGVARGISIVACLVLLVAEAAARSTSHVYPPCAPADHFPAYSHNDQRRSSRGDGAILYGFSGLEIDLQYVRGRLLLGHDLEVTRPDLTFGTSYLRWLEDRRKRCGAILPEGRPFWLFIDLKTKGMGGYRALRAALASSESLFTRVRSGDVRPGPVTVVLVGWCPPLDSLKAEETRYVSVHRLLEETTPADLAEPTHLVRLISLDARRLKGWSGKGAAPRSWADALERLRAARGGVNGRITRLLHSRVNAGIYAYALEQGVDLIGTESLEESRGLLAAIGR